jgi:hypothetical protein
MPLLHAHGSSYHEEAELSTAMFNMAPTAPTEHATGSFKTVCNEQYWLLLRLATQFQQTAVDTLCWALRYT